MKRVAIVTTEPTASRVPQFDLLSRRAEFDLMVFYAAESVQGRTWSLTLDHPHEVLTGPSLPLTWLLQHDYPVTPSLWIKLSRGRFDCVVIWGWSTFAAQLAIAWCRKNRVPYVLFAESHLGERRPTWARVIKRLLVPTAVRHASAWLATGTLAREHLVYYGARPRDTWTFANTIDVAAFTSRANALREHRAAIRASFGLESNGVVVLHAGRLIPVKGVDVLVDAVSQVEGTQLLIVGHGPERTALEARATQRAIKAQFTGFIERDRLIEAYVAADVFCLLSRRETWGVVVNEAAAAGLPLVLSDGVGAAPDLLEPGRNGERVPIADVSTTAAALSNLTTNAMLRESYGRRSTEIVSNWGYGPSELGFTAAIDVAITK